MKGACARARVCVCTRMCGGGGGGRHSVIVITMENLEKSVMLSEDSFLKSTQGYTY